MASPPRAFTAARLLRVSSASSQPVARQGPPAISENRAQRWDMDLSPGTTTVPRNGRVDRGSSEVRILPPAGDHPKWSGSPVTGNEMRVMLNFSVPREGDRRESLISYNETFAGVAHKGKLPGAHIKPEMSPFA